MKPTFENSVIMVKTYDWSISQLSDISLYGPPTLHVHYLQLYGNETREESLRTDLERRAYWLNIMEKGKA